MARPRVACGVGEGLLLPAAGRRVVARPPLEGIPGLPLGRPPPRVTPPGVPPPPFEPRPQPPLLPPLVRMGA